MTSMYNPARPLMARVRFRLPTILGYAVALLLCVPSAILAADEEPDPLDASARRLEEALENEPGLSDETRAALREVARAFREERDRLKAEVKPPEVDQVDREVDAYLKETTPWKGEKKKSERYRESASRRQLYRWWESIQGLNVFANLELRAEGNTNLDDQPSRPRFRVRFRLGAHYRWTDEFLFGVRFTTGDPDRPEGPYQDFGNGLDSYDFTIDQLFARYTPKWAQSWWLDVGKVYLPFLHNPVYDQIIWDHDINPEGFFVGYDRESGGWRLRAVGGFVTLLEQQYATDPYQFMGQLSAEREKGDWKFRAAADFYWYSDADPLISRNDGNAEVDTDGDGVADAYVSNYGVGHALLGAIYKGWKVPIVLGFDYLQNARAKISRDKGFAIGVACGALEAPDLEGGHKGDWRLWYQFMYVGQDSVFSNFAQDDALLRTNARSHLFGATYMPLDRVYLRAWAMGSSRIHLGTDPTTDSNQYQWRIRFDVKFDF